jgi:hypothetical protein
MPRVQRSSDRVVAHTDREACAAKLTFLLTEQERENFFGTCRTAKKPVEDHVTFSHCAHRTRAHKVRQNDCAAFEIARQVCASE